MSESVKVGILLQHVENVAFKAFVTSISRHLGIPMHALSEIFQKRNQQRRRNKFDADWHFCRYKKGPGKLVVDISNGDVDRDPGGQLVLPGPTIDCYHLQKKIFCSYLQEVGVF